MSTGKNTESEKVELLAEVEQLRAVKASLQEDVEELLKEVTEHRESNQFHFSIGVYQTRAHDTAVYNQWTYTGKLGYATLGLSGEVGEAANKVKKIMRGDYGDPETMMREDIPDEVVEAIKKEMGGAFWYLAEMATVLRVPLGEILATNLATLAGRKEKGTLKGSGDDR